MRAAYVGTLTSGSTSLMRAQWLKEIAPQWEWDWLDTDAPLIGSSRVWKSLAYRYQIGIGARRINDSVHRWIDGKSFDLVWVDKAIFLTPRTVGMLRDAARHLVHFTPDTAFHANRSRNFERSLREFDLLVTTKAFEVFEYRKRTDKNTVLLTTQGFDPRVHHPVGSPYSRVKEVVFIGLAEPDREKCLTTLLDHAIPVRLAGHNWEQFISARGRDPLLHFEGSSAFGEQYARLLSNGWVGLGLLSKRFPELHTTRTFEIPACGAILATEANAETRLMFNDDEALFFDDFGDLAKKVRRVFENDEKKLQDFAERGRRRVVNDGRDYPTILSSILADQRIS